MYSPPRRALRWLYTTHLLHRKPRLAEQIMLQDKYVCTTFNHHSHLSTVSWKPTAWRCTWRVTDTVTDTGLHGYSRGIVLKYSICKSSSTPAGIPGSWRVHHCATPTCRECAVILQGCYFRGCELQQEARGSRCDSSICSVSVPTCVKGKTI